MIPKNIYIIASTFYKDLTDELIQGVRSEAVNPQHKLHDDTIVTIIKVPGAFEIPGTAKQLLNKSNSSCIICLGSVVKGETAHFEYISKGVTDGIMKLTLKSKIPIIFGVLTVFDYSQALSRASIEHRNKGAELIEAALLSIKTYNKINS